MSEPEQNDTVYFHLEVNQGYDRVRDMVQTRLIECGWSDQVRLLTRKAITESETGIPTVPNLMDEILPKARSLVPDAVKRELLNEVETILTNLDRLGYAKTF